MFAGSFGQDGAEIKGREVPGEGGGGQIMLSEWGRGFMIGRKQNLWCGSEVGIHVAPIAKWCT